MSKTEHATERRHGSAERTPEAETYLGAVVAKGNDRYRVIDIEHRDYDDPLLANEPSIVAETRDGGRRSWGLSCFPDDDVIGHVGVPDRTDAVVPISVQNGLLTESRHSQNNGVVTCRDCDEFVREPEATPHRGEPTDAHSHAAWTCDSCSVFTDDSETATTLDLSEDDLDDCPWARWSDRMQMWTIGSDYRRDDGLWMPESQQDAWNRGEEEYEGYGNSDK